MKTHILYFIKIPIFYSIVFCCLFLQPINSSLAQTRDRLLIKNLEKKSDLYEIQKLYKKTKLSYSQVFSSDNQAEFDSLFIQWPAFLKKFSIDHIKEIYIVKGLGSFGTVLKRKKQGHFIVLLNESLLSTAPNDWASKAELKFLDSYSVYMSLLFDKKNVKKFEVRIENNDEPILTLENVLIHEIGHIFGDLSGLTPRLFTKNENCYYPFYSKNLYCLSDYIALSAPPAKGLIDFYFLNENEERWDILGFIDLSNSMANSSYSTIDTMINSNEFFAECFFSYVHCVLMKRPFFYTISTELEQFQVQNGFVAERCSFEKSLIELKITETFYR